MKISMVKKYRTRDGREPRIICIDAGGNYPVVGVMDTEVYRWAFDGRRYLSAGASELDLIEYHEPDIRTIWVNVYEDKAYGHHSERDARHSALHDCISIAQPVTFEVRRS